MLAIEIDLLASRYHATEWGRAANEGIPEWPPSPWRLGRALASAWWRSGVATRPDPEIVDSLLRSLAEPPVIDLPRATVGHTRHFMPLPREREARRLVLDPFVRTNGDPLVFVWPQLDLDDESRLVLGELLSRVGYLGRAESACRAHVAAAVTHRLLRAVPLGDTDVGEGELVRVLCLAEDVSLGALSTSTGERRRRGLVQPPAGRFVTYARPASALRDPPRRQRTRTAPRARAVRFAVESSAPPRLTQALAVTELLRAAVLRRADRANPAVVELLRGKADDGTVAKGHRHAHYLATDENGDRRVDHLAVWAPEGFDREALRALDIVTLSSWRFDHPLHLVLLDVERDAGISAGPFATARVWSSHTPFLPTRHPKARGARVVDAWDEQLAVELERRAFPRPFGIRRLRSGPAAWGEYARERRAAEPRVDLPALGFRVEFDEPVKGPIAVGRNSHFGMGLFLPCE